MSFAPYDELEATLASVERALQALDDGSYGRCDVCGCEIGDDVLEAKPTATRCVQHHGD